MQPINSGPSPKPVLKAGAPVAPKAAVRAQRLGAYDALLVETRLALPGKDGEVPETRMKGLDRLRQLLATFLKPKAEASGPQEPSTRVSKELAYHVDTSKNQAKTPYERESERDRDQAESKAQSKRADIAPGVLLKRSSNGGTYGIRELREDSPFERDIAITGLKKTEKGWSVPTIANPQDPKGQFDPFATMPNIVFSGSEDSFPVRPDLDGDGKPTTDAERYDHGVIGGKQPLTAAYSVSKKGEYTVMTYSFYYVDNKFTNYHRTDSSTVSVYLKPDKNGKLQPEYLYNSWHFGGNMTRWSDLKKGPDGRPVVLVERGSHAVHAFGKQEKLPTKGLWINGDGNTALNGKPLKNRLSLLTPQANVKHATRLDPANAKDLAAMDTYFAKYPERTHPIHPILFKELGGLK
ncbi:MAG TPA: hypothetical protein V6D00_07330 [Pantanalinema sp.]